MVLNQSLQGGGSPEATLHALQSEFVGLGGVVRDDCAERYHEALRKAQEEKGEVSARPPGLLCMGSVMQAHGYVQCTCMCIAGADCSHI